MTQDYKHPITPPPHELVEQWRKEPGISAPFSTLPPCVMVNIPSTKLQVIATRAAQWGADQANADIERKLQEAADQELEACRMEIIDGAGLFYIDETSERVRLAEDIWTARRPQPPNLKRQALDILNDAHRGDFSDDEMATIRRALEQLPTHD